MSWLVQISESKDKLTYSLHLPDNSRAECPAGHYSNGRSTSCSPCERGFVCSVGSTSPTPPDGICSPGGWCDGL